MDQARVGSSYRVYLDLTTEMHQQLDQQGRDGHGSQQFQADAYIPHFHQHARYSTAVTMFDPI